MIQAIGFIGVYVLDDLLEVFPAVEYVVRALITEAENTDAGVLCLPLCVCGFHFVQPGFQLVQLVQDDGLLIGCGCACLRR